MPSISLRRAALALAVLVALSACDRSATTNPVATTPATTPAPAAPTSGIDLAGIDKAVQPGDDFDQYANGTWAKVTEIPADRSSTGTFLKIAVSNSFAFCSLPPGCLSAQAQAAR